MARLRPELAKVIGANSTCRPCQDINIGGRLEQAQYQYTLTDTNTDELNHWAPILLAKLESMKILPDVASDQQIASPHVADRSRSRRGASASTCRSPASTTTLQDAFGQAQIATIYMPTQQAYRHSRSRAGNFKPGPIPSPSLYVTNATGGQVPLSAVTHVTRKVEPLTINHQGVFPSVTLSFNLVPGASLSQAVDAITAAKASLGAPPTLLGQFEGTAQAFQASLVSHAAPGHGGDRGDLHHHGDALRELHPPDHHSLRPSAGRRGRAADR